MKRETLKGLEFIMALVISFQLAFTALDKLWHYAIFRAQLKESPWGILAGHSDVVAWGIPLLELSITLLLLNCNTRRLGFRGSMVLFTVFSAYILWIGTKKIPVPCGCSLFIEKLSFRNHLWLNTGMIVIAIVGLLLNNKNIVSRSMGKAVA